MMRRWTPILLLLLAIGLGLASQLASIFGNWPRWLLIGLAVAVAAIAATQAFVDERARRRALPQPPLDLRQLPQSVMTRLLFGARAVPFQAYEEQVSAMHMFLSGQANFSWWIVTGEAGAGKSRLALEICLQLKRWDRGFLGGHEKFNEWRQWQPRRPTLIIVDYVRTRGTEVHDILATLSEPSHKLDKPVRVLLLERRLDAWLSEVIGTGGDQYLIAATRHAEEPLHLGGLDPEAQWRMVGEVLQQHGIDELPPKPETLDALREFDPDGRPLFVMLAAEAIAEGQQPQGLRDRMPLLRQHLDREIQRFWTPAGVTERDKNLLALSTVTGGLAVKDLKVYGSDLLPSVDASSPDRFSADRYQAMTGHDARSRLAPLEPDLIGELFVLDHLTPRDGLDSRVDFIQGWAVATNHLQYVDFVYRSLDDFPGHKLLERLRFHLTSPIVDQLVAVGDEDHDKEWSALIFAAVHGNHLIGLLEAGDIQAAQLVLDELRAFADRWPGTKKLVAGMAPWVFEAYLTRDDVGMAAILRDLSAYWPSVGEVTPSLEVFVRTLLLRASACAEIGRTGLSHRLVAASVEFTDRQQVTILLAPQLAEGLRGVVQAFADKLAIEDAQRVFERITALSVKVPLTPDFAKPWGLAAMGLLLASAQLATDEWPDAALAAIESGSKVVFSAEFAEAMAGSESDRYVFSRVQEAFNAARSGLDDS